MIKEGQYVKLNYGGVERLVYIPNTKEDGYFNMYKALGGKGSWGFQCCEEKEELKNFENITFTGFNIYGQILGTANITFDFENNVVELNGKRYKVKEDREYTYKIQKTQIKAINGIKGLYKFVVEEMKSDSCFNYSFLSVINRASA